MLVHTRSTWRHNPEGGILHSHHRENLKSFAVIHSVKNQHAGPSAGGFKITYFQDIKGG
jgi:hypothetical protein